MSEDDEILVKAGVVRVNEGVQVFATDNTIRSEDDEVLVNKGDKVLVNEGTKVLVTDCKRSLTSTISD